MNVLPTWVAKLNVQPGDHILAIVTDEDYISLLPPYASDGMNKGDTCNVFARDHELETVRQYMRQEGVAVDEAERCGRLTFGDPQALGRNEAGEFDTQLLLDNLEQFAKSLKDRDIQHLRCMGSMSWLPGPHSAEDGIYLCARLNQIFRDRPVSGL